jgi:hypothetical protein
VLTTSIVNGDIEELDQEFKEVQVDSLSLAKEKIIRKFGRAFLRTEAIL